MSDEENLSVEYRLTLEDYLAMCAHLNPPHALNRGPVTHAFRLLVLATVVAALFVGDRGVLFLFGFIVALLFCAAYLKHLSTRSAKLTAPRDGGYVLCSYRAHLSDAGIHLETPFWAGTSMWRGLLAVEETPTHVFLRTDTLAAYAIPRDAFRSAPHLEEFVQFARDRSESDDSPA